MELRVLGSLEMVSSAGSPLAIPSAKQRELLAFLAAHAPAVVSTDRIVDALWGSEDFGGVSSLHYHISKLRDAIDPERNEDVIITRAPGYCLGLPPDGVDAHRFESLVGRAEEATGADRPALHILEDALALWRGPPYAEFEYADWARAEVLRLTELRMVARELWFNAQLDTGHSAVLVGELESAVIEHPLRERLWGQLMLALYRSGRQPEALRAYRRALEVFADLGTEPSEELSILEEQILLRDIALEASTGGDLLGTGRPGAAIHTVPQFRTGFVGRQRELGTGETLLAGSRLLTLTGPPGSGKTRLGVELAIENADEFPDGTYFVPLAAVTDVRLVATTIASALGLRDAPDEEPADGLRRFLRDRRTLLVLDNFEQIIGAAPLLSELLDAAPLVTILATSRSPLGISGEQEFAIAPMPLPPIDKPLGTSDILANDAVALFEMRARAADPNFRITEETAAQVAEITVRLDGLPLAIELAAARMKLLTPEDVLARLREHRPVLAEGPADTAQRHRTLRAAIVWSHDLLTTDEQRLFRSLGVLRSFSLDAAASIARLSETATFDGVDGLLSKSLVLRRHSGNAARFAMLETLREFALEQLAAAGELEELTRRHANHYRHLAEDSELGLTRSNAHSIVHQLSTEIDNMRAALQYAIDQGNPDLGLYLAGSIWRFYQITGRLIEGRQWLQSLLSNPGASDEARAKGLTGLAGLAYWQGDSDEALTRYEEALECYRSVGDRFGEADTLYSMSLTLNLSGNAEPSGSLATEALGIFEELGSREKVGEVKMAGAVALHTQGRHAEARPLWEAALGISRELGNHQLAVTQLIGLGICEYHEGNMQDALRIALDSLDEAVELENIQVTVWLLEYIAAFSASAAPDEAVRLAGSVDVLRQETGGGIALNVLGIEDPRSVASRVLDPDDLDRAWSDGQTMALNEAIEYAQSFARQPL